MSWRALQWAFDCDKTESTAERVVLVAFANHADDRGYTWPSQKFMASVWHLDRKTVRRAIAALLVRRAIYPTKKHRGNTGRQKVYRMPKITWERGCERDSLKQSEIVPKLSHNSPIIGCERDTNPDTDNLEPNISDNKTWGSSLAEDVNKVPAKESKSFSGSYQNHIKFREFASWCEKKDGTPTEAGFWKWMRGQKPQWRNKPQPAPEEENGYVLDGKFYTNEAANRLGMANADLVTKFQRAVKRNGKVLKVDAGAL